MINSGDLKERVALDKREPTNDGAGNYQSDFVEQFNRRASFVYAGGSEAVMAERLEGRSVFKVRLRKCDQTKLITSGWQLRDTRRGTVYAIREVDAVTHPLCVFLTVMSGVAS
ncbi:head-tail adaptor protein (plasmid) [Agrobacterium rosae]|uniref:Head-tail adaptor protein n=1 Tax=Agrobacterium rosae TaxID=1972867 RepID=A0ABU4W8B2_9HYPH|nr:head-tail adaptor protein [Agrobacterium rosae]MDX8332897.1 head-tail adaptor protein [Agrobacterium rosae]